ncbi:MAG: PfkB family carbohydrate kinase [Gemmatimonadota bacterium]|nr:PfkB family carbohydrate kinase [Gemmatimonadota bacterium]MYD63214.1 carbohydrate kinase [Gemmatimonadota bacterium]
MRRGPPSVVAIGAVLWDVFPDGERLGGAPANFAVHAAALGARAAMVSCVGDDARGKTALEILSGRGVATDALQVHAYRPTGSVNVTLVDGQPTYEIVEGVAWDAITWCSELAPIAQSAHALCFGTIDQREAQSRRAIINFLDAASPDCLRVFDINFRQHYHTDEIVRESLTRADVLKLNDEEVVLLRDYVGGEEDVDVFLTGIRARFDLQCVILTLGEQGCWVVSEGGICQAVGKRQQVVNTVGAGDAFTAAFVMHLLAGAPMQICAEQANTVGGFVTTQDSGMPPLPARFRIF